ncbi:MAG: hypothetical protein WC227_02885 [Patescibacteria group bacterium]|jgi:hypothetical protein
MFNRLREIQIDNKIVNLLNRPIIVGHEVDESGKVINYILGVSDSIRHSGKSFELTLSKWQYILFLYQKLNKRRFVKSVGAIMVALGLIFGSMSLIYFGGILSLICDYIWLSSKEGRRNWREYLAAYVLGVLIFGWSKGIFAGSAVLIIYAYLFDPYFFFELNPSSGLDIDQIQHLKKKVVKQ